ncbi:MULTISPECIES: YeiH family protein [unclassified Beijerinckia]|uniref:YeiH family protein n=1 Tax=unclassified Beijerinckia TaxID=2638183 RepID=UPI0008968800|nr:MULTISPECIES: YeiH family protein [unclassified Beijerinckia]MDH7797063.1 putative integral membrane protein (TIGR00698 family) [Beijerinckia sp. GAS462]SEC70776.1 conserved hypothetical integral membrane protein [Beijerinckia sp. 28-YEA-48]
MFDSERRLLDPPNPVEDCQFGQHSFQQISPTQRFRRLRGRSAEILAECYPGLVAAGTVGIAGTWLSQHFNAPVMLLALLLGIAFNFLYEEKRCHTGIEFASRQILRCGVALLGVRISISQISSLGFMPIATVVVGILLTIMAGVWFARKLGLSTHFGLLSGGAVSICGASAALAISTALPSYPGKERDTSLTVVGVTTLSTIAMIVYPIIVSSAGLKPVDAGLFLGGTIHDVAQVVGAGYMISPEVGDVSTYVKLLRVACLILVVFGITLYFSRSKMELDGRRRLPSIPLFLVGFIGLVLFNSTFELPPNALGIINATSNWCLVTAISALGMKTSLANLAKVGWMPVMLLLWETVWIAIIVLSSIFLI